MLDIYIKPVKKLSTDKREIVLGDIAEVVSSDADARHVKIIDVPASGKTSLLISVVDIIRVLKSRYPDAAVMNLGENEILISYMPQKARKNKLLEWLKVTFVTIILFVGSATAIMSFYTDAQMNKIFENMHYVITGERRERPMLIEIPYCIGLAAGIIVFFNHVGGKKLSSDPTPIEVEMASYDSEVTDTTIHMLSAERRQNDV